MVARSTCRSLAVNAKIKEVKSAECIVAEGDYITLEPSAVSLRRSVEKIPGVVPS